MRCLFLYLSLIFSIFPCYESYQEGILFTTPGYPQPYTGQLSQRATLSVNSTQGVAVVFEQFLASAHDCVIACPTSDSGCSSLCGDAMDHGLIPKILRVPGNAAITMVSIEQNDGFPHSGISAKILPYDLQQNTFFNCNDQVDLSSGETFYMISQNYPSTPSTSFSECSIKFSTSGTRQGIRFAVYDFYLNAQQQDNFEITGGSGGNVKITGFATEDEPLVYYFQNSASVNFSIASTHSIFQKRFYILVKSYETPSASNNGSCAQTGAFEMSLNQIIRFGTNDFGKAIYGNNMNCPFNFTRNPVQNSLFALAIQYETEKCCDTMSIDGLSIWEQVYQGFQSSNLFFTRNAAISFLFQTDPVVGGTGFNASIQHIDCTCPSSMILVKNGVLTSPGYSTSLSYCPGIFCEPEISFQDDLYDLQLIFSDVNLRTYSPNNQTDYVGIVDSYAHSVVQMQPGYAGFNTFWATVSPVTVQFSAQYIAAIPLNMIGRGFSINLNLIKKDYVRKMIIFDDGNFFQDITDLDLYSGKTFEFNVKGRQGHKIFIYFFTKTTNQVFVDIFDGDSMDAQRIDNKALYANIQENGVVYVLRTTAEKAVIHIRGNPTTLNIGTDFQAMITDLEIDSHCGPLVYSLRNAKSISNINLNGQNCYKILHFTDSSLSPTAFMNVAFSKSIDMDVFYGLTTNNNLLIAKSKNVTLPQDLFTNYLVLKYSTTDMASLNYNWDISSGIVARTMQATDTVLLMSADYGKSPAPSVVQQFSVQLEGESNVQTGLQVEFLADAGLGSCTLSWSDFDAEITTKSLTPAKKSQIFSSCGNKLLVDYSSSGDGSNNGLYMKITRADLRCSLALNRSISIVVLVVTLLHVMFS